MDPDLFEVIEIYISHVLNGKFPAHMVKTVALELPADSTFRATQLMAVAIVEGNPLEVIRLGGSVDFLEGDKKLIETLLMCAANMLKERGYLEEEKMEVQEVQEVMDVQEKVTKILKEVETVETTEEVPQLLPGQVLMGYPTRKHRNNQRTPLTKEAKTQLNNYFDAVNGEVTEEVLQAYAEIYKVELATVRSALNGWKFRKVNRGRSSK